MSLMEAILLMIGRRRLLVKGITPLAILHFCQNIRESSLSNTGQGRGDGTAIRETTRRWSFQGMGRGLRPSASPCGNPIGSAEESGVPGRCFRESRRRPRAPSQLSSLKKMIKSEGGQALTPLGNFAPALWEWKKGPSCGRL